MRTLFLALWHISLFNSIRPSSNFDDLLQIKRREVNPGTTLASFKKKAGTAESGKKIGIFNFFKK